MSSRILRKQYLAITTALILMSILAASVVVIQTDWHAFHKNVAREYPRVNWLNIFFRQAFNHVNIQFFAGTEVGLPPVKLYLSLNAESRLLESPPESGKKWQKAYVMSSGGRLESVKARLRGENPRNWLFSKKSWRIKLRKKNLIGRQRVFNYLVPDTGSLLTEHLAMLGARTAGLIAPKSRLVELFINDVSSGVAVEYEHFDESFLRNRKIMPVNLYKGEQINNEMFLGVSQDLFNNPLLWSRQANDNQFKIDDFQDLQYAFDLVNSALVDQSKFAALKQVVPINEWARFDAYRTVVGNYFANASHNQRLLADGWRGEVLPIVNSDGGVNKARLVEESHGRIMDVYIQSSEYLAARYKHIYDLVYDKQIIEKLLDAIRNQEDMLAKSVERDKSLTANIFWANFPEEMPAEKQGWYVEELKKMLLSRQQWLERLLTQAPKVEAIASNHKISLTVFGYMPVHKLKITSSIKNRAISEIYWDKNNNGIIDSTDTLLPSKSIGDKHIVDAMFFANRQIFAGKNEITDQTFQPAILPVKTTFNLISNSDLSISQLKTFNAFTDKYTRIDTGKDIGAAPSTYNIPVFDIHGKKTQIWSGKKYIHGQVTIDYPVEVAPGTRILLDPGASLIFENKLIMNGTKEHPIEVTQSVPGTPWRAFAIVGESASGSTIEFTNFSGGSGGRVGNRNYTAMFSIHSANSITVSNATFRNAQQYDDVIHIVYGSDIKINTPTIEGAFSDAIDVDVSTVEIRNPNIVNSGNDGLDFMESEGLVIGGIISSSGDKGISVGEASEILIIDTTLSNNSIGLEAKDSSSVIIVRSKLEMNRIQLSAYSKNWRYGEGGNIALSHTLVKSLTNVMDIKKGSHVEIHNSVLSPSVKDSKRVKVFHPSTQLSENILHETPYPKRIHDAFLKWKITPNSDTLH